MDNHQQAQEMAFMLLVAIIHKRKKSTDVPLDLTNLGYPFQKLIEAFDHVDDYQLHKKKKRSGGYRTISEPHEALKLVQRRLLKHFLHRLWKRTIFYRHTKKGIDTAGDVFYRPVLKHLLDSSVHGMVKNRSIVTAMKQHCSELQHCILQIDLKDAFPSVTFEVLRTALCQIVTDDCKAIFLGCKRRLFGNDRKEIAQSILHHVGKVPRAPYGVSLDLLKQQSQWEEDANRLLFTKGFGEVLSPYSLRQATIEFEETETFPFYKPQKNEHHRYSLFPQHVVADFRKFIRDEAYKFVQFENSTVPLVIEYFVNHLCRLVCYEGMLPQGAPTSGFLLAVVISATGLLKKIRSVPGVKDTSLYVDDIVIPTTRRPDDAMIAAIQNVIAETGIFSCHPQKIRQHDLRKKSGFIFGMKLVRRRATEKELIRLFEPGKFREFQSGLSRAAKKRRPWEVMSVTLSKKKQKQYRAFLHLMTNSKGTSEQMSIAMGYHGHIVSVYGSKVTNMPASLKKVVSTFRTLFIREKEYKDEKQRTAS